MHSPPSLSLSILITLALFSSALAAPTTPSPNLIPRETDLEATDRLLFSTPLSDFLIARAAQDPPTLDWGSNGCSYSPDNPFGFDFLNSCHRHDFGYKNYKHQSRFTEPNRKRIDDNFKKDLYNQCNKEGGVFEVAACKGVANIYYEAVRALGGTLSGKRDVGAAGIEVMERGVDVVWSTEFEAEMLARVRDWDDVE